jgi:uncharacterized protein YjbI with pentapeptide repeats
MKKRKKPILKSMLMVYEPPFRSSDDLRIEDKEMNQVTIENHLNLHVVFDTVIFIDCTITNNVFKRAEFMNCVFQNCDFSNNRLEHTTFVRCEFVKSKLMGTSIIESGLSHVLMKHCMAKYLDLANNVFDVVEIETTILDESNWFETTIKHLKLKDVSLVDSKVYQTSFDGVDLSASHIEGMKMDLRDIKGATINPEQAVLLCPLIGVHIK